MVPSPGFDVILGGIVLGLLSAPVSIIKKPRFFWGSAAFDPISFFWMAAFFLYGPVGALLSSVIGAASIAFFSKEATPVLGAVLKFTGTLTVWSTLYGTALFVRQGALSAGVFHDLALYAKAAAFGAALRCVVEIPACYTAIPYFLSRATKKKITAKEMLSRFGGAVKYVLIMIALNIYLTLLDAFFSWLLVFPTGVYVRFAVW